MGDLADAIQRLEAEPNRARTVHLDADLRPVIAAAKRPPLTDATRKRLIEIMQGIQFGNPRNPYTYGAGVVDVFADAILAECAPVASTRERLAGAMRAAAGVTPETQEAGLVKVVNSEDMADALIALGDFEDRAEVEAKVRAAVADEVLRWGAGRHLIEDVVTGIAASIREGRS